MIESFQLSSTLPFQKSSNKPLPLLQGTTEIRNLLVLEILKKKYEELRHTAFQDKHARLGAWGQRKGGSYPKWNRDENFQDVLW